MFWDILYTFLHLVNGTNSRAQYVLVLAGVTGGLSSSLLWQLGPESSVVFGGGIPVNLDMLIHRLGSY